MAARAIWKGVIRFPGVEVPVKLYSAVQDRKIHFRLLHEKDMVPVRQEMVNPDNGRIVPYNEIIRGYEIEPGEIVILDDQELKSLEPEPSREIEVSRFVDRGLLNHQWYDRPYFMGPDGSVQAYYALARALGKSGTEGVARWTMRGKEYVGSLQAEGDFLKVITLFHTEEVIRAEDLPRPGGRDLTEQELAMAEQLVRALEGDFRPEQYRDEFRDRVMDLVQTKARGGTVRFRKVKEKKPREASLAQMLEQSVKKAKKERKVA